MGMVTVCLSIYLSEIATKELRGLLGSFLQFFAVAGILMVYIFGVVLNWNWLAVVSIALALFNVIFLAVSCHDKWGF